MGTGCSTNVPPVMALDKGQMKHESGKMTRTRNRIRKQSTTSSSDVNVKVSKPKQWVQPLPTPMPKGIPHTPDVTQLAVDENGARLSVATQFSGSDALSVSEPSTRSSYNLSASSHISTATIGTQKMGEQWKMPPRIASLTPDMQNLLLGHQNEPSKLLQRPRVIRLQLIAPGEEIMKERLALWSGAFMPLRKFCAQSGYALDIQDDLWSSTNLNKAYIHLLTLQSDDGSLVLEKNTDNDEDEIEYGIDLLVVVLAKVFSYRLPPVLSREDYTLVVVSLPDSTVTALFHDLYANNENRSPPAYELQHQVMIKQEEAKLTHLIELMVDIFKREHRDNYIYHSDYYNHLSRISLNKALLGSRIVVIRLDRAVNEHELSQVKDGKESAKDNAYNTSHTVSMLADLMDKCPDENRIQLILLKQEYTEDGSDEKDVNAGRRHDMSTKVEEILERLVTKVIQQNDAESREIVTGVPRSLVEELVTQTKHAKRLASVKPILESATLVSLKDYLLTISEMPIVIYAEAGWGLSTMGAQLVESCSSSMPTSVIIYRFVGISPDSRSLMSSLLSIQQQLETILGPLKRCAGSKSKAKQVPAADTLLKDIVTRSTSHLPITIILEGISPESAQLTELNVMMLTESLPATTKLLVMTSDPERAKELRSKMKDAFYVKTTPWEKQSIITLFTSSLAKRKRSLTDSQTSAVTTAIQCCPLPMYAVIAAKLASRWRALTDITDDSLPGSVDAIIGLLYEHLEHCIPLDCFSAMMAYLTESVGGVSKWEMSDLLSVNDSALLSIYSDVRDPPIHRAPPVLWKFISVYLRDHLNLFMSQDFCSYWLASCSLRTCAVARYVSSSVTATILHREISDHFMGRWADKRKPYPDPEEEIELLQDRFVMPQPDRYGNHLNTRKFMFLPYHLMCSKNKNAYMLETCIFNLSWIENKLNCVSILQVICDLEHFKSLETSLTALIKTMQQAILISSTKLHIHGGEIYSCLHKHMISALANTDNNQTNALHTRNNTGLGSFYALLARPPAAFLHPLESLMESPSQLTNSPIPVPVIDAIIPISHDSHEVHVAAVLKSEGEIKILNMITNKTVRILTGIDHPQTLKMVNSTTVVALCNRELLVVDLDEGQLITKLRGVLNLKLPLFGLQSDNKVVALSRDRMVVNIFDINTGAIVTTFKAGETRFLDSLIISGDGKVLVCGDETQKPFPLLVWSLEQAKLLHDIRMPQHEFITQLAAITDNGQYLACGCREINALQSNFIAVYDLVSGHLLKKIKMAAVCTAVAMSSRTNSLVIALDTGQVAVWDVVSGSHRFLLEGGRVEMNSICLTPDGKMCLTSHKNDYSISSHSLNLWNLEEGKFVACYTFDSPVTSTLLTVDGNMVLVGVKGQPNPIRLLLVPEGSNVMSAKSEWESKKDAESIFGDAVRHEQVITVCCD